MAQLLIILTVFLSSSAFAQMDRFYNNHVGAGTIYGNPSGTHRYQDTQRNSEMLFTSPQSGISSTTSTYRAG
jgi:hypothetical protein